VTNGRRGSGGSGVPDLLIDTDVFIDHLRGERELLEAGNAICYSVVTRCELFAGPPAHEERVGELLAPLRELAIDGAIAERAGRIRHDTGMRTPDALIAATAMLHRLTLVTRNRRDFERVGGLQVRAP
jgi:predicted nucleic acid-binding protein